MRYAEAIEWLYGTQWFGIKLGLDNMARLLAAFRIPQRFPDRKVLHVAGTNGKGSVCAMADAICRAGGLTSGLFTSPHLVSYRERIQVSGRMIPEADVARLLTEIRDLVQDWEPHPTFFEITLTLALRHYLDEEADVLILETGMGGRLDATNIITPDVAVITPIGLDHQKWLGESLAAIAGEKAGIIKRHVPVISAPQEPEAADVIREFAEKTGSPLTVVQEPVASNVPLGLAGEHQRWNAAVALEALRQGGLNFSDRVIAQGLREVTWRARFQRLETSPGTVVVVDGGHNADAIRTVVDTWKAEYSGERTTVIFGAVEGKAAENVLPLLAEIAERIIFVRVNSPRGLPAEQLLDVWQQTTGPTSPGPIPASTAPTLEAALAEARSGTGSRILVTGSLYLAGEALAKLTPGEEGTFEASAQ